MNHEIILTESAANELWFLLYCMSLVYFLKVFNSGCVYSPLYFEYFQSSRGVEAIIKISQFSQQAFSSKENRKS